MDGGSLFRSAGLSEGYLTDRAMNPAFAPTVRRNPWVEYLEPAANDGEWLGQRTP